MSDIVSRAIVSLFESEMFYAEVISQMRRILDPKFKAVAGVCIKDHIEMVINPVLFEALQPEQRVAILKHECEHILRDHINRMKEIVPEAFNKQKDLADALINGQKFKAMNVAADCAINYSLQHLPEWGCFPKNFGLKDGETFEWYLEQLKNNEKMKQLTEYDDHSLWTESEGQKEVIKEKIRQAINKAAKRTRAAGHMTAEYELLVDNFNSGNSVNWRQQLKRFVVRSLEVKIESSKKKRNRRYGIMYPGEIKIEDLHIGVAMDTSGSVSDEALKQFMKEINSIAKNAKVSVVEADTEIKNSYVFNPKKKYEIKGRGGTAYKPAFDWFNKEGDIDAMIYFGDMDCYDTEEIKKPKYPVLWAIVGSQEPPVKWGGRIQIKVDGE